MIPASVEASREGAITLLLLAPDLKHGCVLNVYIYIYICICMNHVILCVNKKLCSSPISVRLKSIHDDRSVMNYGRLLSKCSFLSLNINIYH